MWGGRGWGMRASQFRSGPQNQWPLVASQQQAAPKQNGTKTRTHGSSVVFSDSIKLGAVHNATLSTQCTKTHQVD